MASPASISDLKILIVGCGSMGTRHAHNLVKLGTKVSVCDVDVDRLNKLATTLGLTNLFADYEEAISSNVDAVIIATPSNLHFKQGMMAIKHGKHVLMEKPMTEYLGEAIELQAAVEKSGLVFMMAHTYRFRPEWKKVQNVFKEFELGKILTASFAGGWYLPDWHYRENYKDEYAAKKEMGGGVVLTGLSHIFDLTIWLFGDVENFSGIKAKVSNLDIDVEDHASCTILTDRGILVTIQENFLERCPKRNLRVTADRGHYEFDFIRNVVNVWSIDRRRRYPGAIEGRKKNDLYQVIESGLLYDLSSDKFSINSDPPNSNLPYTAELVYFLDKVRSKTKCFSLDANAGLKVMRLIQNENWKNWGLS